LIEASSLFSTSRDGDEITLRLLSVASVLRTALTVPPEFCMK
jgi:hypothetical protein